MPTLKPFSWTGPAAMMALLLALFGLAHLADGWVVEHVTSIGISNKDVGRLFRIMGFVPTWLVIAGALGLIAWHEGRPAIRMMLGRIVLLLSSVLLSGLMAEVVKLLIRRQRPSVDEAGHWLGYLFRSFSDKPWSTSGLGFPSSHATVAFAAAWALSWLYPKGWPLWLAMAIGCAATRVLERAHYLSDVLGSAWLSYLIVMLLWRLFARLTPNVKRECP